MIYLCGNNNQSVLGEAEFVKREEVGMNRLACFGVHTRDFLFFQ